MGAGNRPGIKARGLSIQIDFRYRGLRCRETLKLEPTKANQLYADRLRSEILRKIELGTFTYAEYFPDSPKAKLGKSAIPTFGSAATSYLKTCAALAKSSYMTYKKNLDKHWLPEFKDRRIDSITYSEILEHLSELEVTAKTRNNILIPFRRILDAAFIDGIITVNPASRIRNIKVQKPEPDPLSLREVDILLAHIKKKYDEQILNYFEFAIFSGVRTCEIIEVQWGDVEDDRVIIRRARVEGETKSTKTCQVRVIELNVRAKQALARQAKYTKLSSKHVFHNPVTNEPWNDQRSQNNIYWQPALLAVKLHSRKAYQTRHTFATLMLMSGANPMWVARQMGHASMKMLLEVYSRWIDQADKSREVDKFNLSLLVTEQSQDLYVTKATS